jgi:hypothetical protein
MLVQSFTSGGASQLCSQMIPPLKGSNPTEVKSIVSSDDEDSCRGLTSPDMCVVGTPSRFSPRDMKRRRLERRPAADPFAVANAPDPPGPSSKMPRRSSKKRVHFEATGVASMPDAPASKDVCLHCFQLPSYTDLDKREAWLAPSEYKRIRGEIKTTLKSFHQHIQTVQGLPCGTGSVFWNENLHSIRGIEHIVSKAFFRTGAVKQRLYVRSILATFRAESYKASHQYPVMSPNTVAESVREASLRLSKLDSDHALQMGIADMYDILE